MTRLIVVVCAVGLLAACGCSKKATDTSKDGSGGNSTRPEAPPPDASPSKVIEDWLTGGNPGSTTKVVSIIKEEKTTFKGKPAQAVAAKYLINDKEDSELFIIQDARVARHGPVEKPFDEALKELLKD